METTLHAALTALGWAPDTIHRFWLAWRQRHGGDSTLLQFLSDGPPSRPADVPPDWVRCGCGHCTDWMAPTDSRGRPRRMISGHNIAAARALANGGKS